jgi:hypothetical protein
MLGCEALSKPCASKDDHGKDDLKCRLTNYPTYQLTPPQGPWLRPEASEVSPSAIAVWRTFTNYPIYHKRRATKQLNYAKQSQFAGFKNECKLH